MVTLKDIAAEAGVSITTVSNVVHSRKSRVSPEVVARIEKIIQREHYAPSMSARSLANDNSSIIGVITHLTPENTGSTVGDPFLGSFVESIEKRTREEGYYLMIRAVRDAAELASLSRSWRLSGLILTGMFQDEFFYTTRDLGIPYVLIDSYVEDPDACRIRPGGVIEKRLLGYRRALQEYGLPFDPSLVFTQEMSVDEGKKLGHTLAARKEITGIFASADILAAGIMAGLSERGVSVPAEKSIIGFDDNYISRLTIPGLTTIHQDAERKGCLATDMILRQLRREPIEEKNIVLPVHLVERGSVFSVR